MADTDEVLHLVAEERDLLRAQLQATQKALALARHVCATAATVLTDPDERMEAHRFVAHLDDVLRLGTVVTDVVKLQEQMNALRNTEIRIARHGLGLDEEGIQS